MVDGMVDKMVDGMVDKMVDRTVDRTLKANKETAKIAATIGEILTVTILKIRILPKMVTWVLPTPSRPLTTTSRGGYLRHPLNRGHPPNQFNRGHPPNQVNRGPNRTLLLSTYRNSTREACLVEWGDCLVKLNSLEGAKRAKQVNGYNDLVSSGVYIINRER